MAFAILTTESITTIVVILMILYHNAREANVQKSPTG